MLRKLLVVLLVVAAIALAAFWFLTSPATVPASALGQHEPNLDNGRQMFFAGGCASCHAAPDQKDNLMLGGGLALRSEFGTFHVPNISPHPTDGIGTWSEADFITAMVKGTAPDGRHYYPAFPYTSYQKMAHADLRDLFAFIGTLKPVEGRIRDHELPFPYNIRRGLGLWKLLHLDGQAFQSDPNQDAEWNRGAYLVNGPAHCAECHSPRNALGGIVEAQRFAGGPDPSGQGWVPNITSYGLSLWDEDALATMLETGENIDADTVSGDMAKVVANTAQLSDNDRRAMAVYIKSLPEVEGPPRPGVD